MRAFPSLCALVVFLSFSLADGPSRASDGKGSDADGITRIADGSGTTEKDALEDAFRNAVRQAVGVVVDEQVMIKNDEVITDKVLTYSGGMVTKYDVLSKKEDKGLIRVKIRATVERRKLVAKLKEAKITVSSVEGKDLAASAITRKEARENAAALLAKKMEELPRVLTAEVRKPKPSDYDEDKKELTLEVTVKADMKKYQAFSKELCELADKVCLMKDSILITGKYKGEEGRDQGQSGRFISESILDAERAMDLQPHPKGWCLCVLSQIDTSGERARWNRYILDAVPMMCFTEVSGATLIRIVLSDKNADVVGEDEFDPHKETPNWWWLGLVNNYRGGPNLVSLFDPKVVVSLTPLSEGRESQGRIERHIHN